MARRKKSEQGDLLTAPVTEGGERPHIQQQQTPIEVREPIPAGAPPTPPPQPIIPLLGKEPKSLKLLMESYHQAKQHFLDISRELKEVVERNAQILMEIRKEIEPTSSTTSTTQTAETTKTDEKKKSFWGRGDSLGEKIGEIMVKDKSIKWTIEKMAVEVKEKEQAVSVALKNIYEKKGQDVLDRTPKTGGRGVVYFAL